MAACGFCLRVKMNLWDGDGLHFAWKKLKTARHSERAGCPGNRPRNGLVQSNYSLCLGTFRRAEFHLETLGCESPIKMLAR